MTHEAPSCIRIITLLEEFAEYLDNARAPPYSHGHFDAYSAYASAMNHAGGKLKELLEELKEERGTAR